MIPIHYIAQYFNQPVDLSRIRYFTLGARPTPAGAIGLDSSDQALLSFDTVSGLTVYRSALVWTDAENRVSQVAVDELRLAVSLPALAGEAGLRLKLSQEQLRRFRTGIRVHFSSLQKPASLMQPRLTAAVEREVTDYQFTLDTLNSLHNPPGLLFMRDGRLNAQKYPGPAAYDRLYRLMTARRVRAVGLAKTARLLEVIRPYARAIRGQVGDQPFAIPLGRAHLQQAHGDRASAFMKTLRHGASRQAYGGVGAVRFALSLAADRLHLVEFNLYDLAAFRPLVNSGQSLVDWARQTFGSRKAAVYSWDILPFVTDEDWQQLFIPTLEQLVFCASADNQPGHYPRALAEAHNRVKIKQAEVEPLRREILAALSRYQQVPETIPVQPEDPHQFDAEVVNQSPF